MLRFRPLPIMTLCMFLAFVGLVLLGRWQWQRYAETSALANAPVADMTLANYHPIEDGLQLVFGVDEAGEPGWRIFAPIRTGEEVVFIDAGFIANDPEPNWRDIVYPRLLSIAAPVSGAPMRPRPPAAFTPPSHPLTRLWQSIDLAAMGRASGLDHVADYYLAIAYIGEDGRARPNPFARANGADALPPERHLGYAFTWWGLALGLVGMYLAYHVQTKRLGFEPRRDNSDPLI